MTKQTMKPNRYSENFSPFSKAFDFSYCSDKETVFNNYCKYTFTRTQSMFVYTGLPDTIPVQYLEKYLQQNGSCCIAEVNGNLYALIGSAGGEYDEYYQPTEYTVSNPYLNLSKTFKIGEDCVYCRNDYEANGLIPLISRYCGLMTENLLTVRLADINMRMMNLLSAPDDNTLQSAIKYLQDLEKGKLGVVGESPFFEGLKLQSNHVGSGDYMIQFIELQQYLKGSLYNELGINANFNMKREALSGEEVALNDDALMPLIDDMLKQRRTMCDELNKMFGLNVSVDYGSAWHSNVMEKQLVGQSELEGSTTESVEFAGDESSLPDDHDANISNEETREDVSQLNAEKETNPDDNNNNSSPDSSNSDGEPTDSPNENDNNSSESDNDNNPDEQSDPDPDTDAKSAPEDDSTNDPETRDKGLEAGDEDTGSGSEDSESEDSESEDSESEDDEKKKKGDC